MPDASKVQAWIHCAVDTQWIFDKMPGTDSSVSLQIKWKSSRSIHEIWEVNLFLAEFFLLAKFINIPNAIVSCTILKKWTLSGWFLEWRSFSFWIRNLLYFWTKCIDFWSLTWKGNKYYLHFSLFFVPNWLDLVESNKVESNLVSLLSSTTSPITPAE